MRRPRQLQWIIDSYNLVFASLVLAGTVSDRFGRKGALLMGAAHPLDASDDASESFGPDAEAAELAPAAPLA